jgi:hypothetical protein
MINGVSQRLFPSQSKLNNLSKLPIPDFRLGISRSGAEPTSQPMTLRDTLRNIDMTFDVTMFTIARRYKCYCTTDSSFGQCSNA